MSAYSASALESLDHFSAAANVELVGPGTLP